jgi:hypothetical protein
VEYFNFDFEFADEPQDTGLKDNIKVWLWMHLIITIIAQ